MSAKVNLVELRNARQAARDALGKAYAENLIDDDELERRLEAVEDAEDPGIVREIYEDVMPVGGSELAVAQPEVTALATVDDAPTQGGVVAIFGEAKRTGAWSPARSNRVQTIFGSTQLDFREARLPEGTTEIDLQLVFGEVQILVPPGLSVETQCSVVLGELDIGKGVTTAAPDPGGPRLLLTGYIVFGSAAVYERLPGESRREARRRHKAERKRLKQERRKALKSGRA